ncbi:MAG: TlpA disulfide reductase family protein [Actinomycetota bacterium]
MLSRRSIPTLLVALMIATGCAAESTGEAATTVSIFGVEQEAAYRVDNNSLLATPSDGANTASSPTADAAATAAPADGILGEPPETLAFVDGLPGPTPTADGTAHAVDAVDDPDHREGQADLAASETLETPDSGAAAPTVTEGSSPESGEIERFDDDGFEELFAMYRESERDSGAPDPDTSAQSPTDQAAALAATPPSMHFRADYLLGGGSTTGVDLYAQRPVLMTFMSPSCAVCAAEAPHIAEAAATYPGITFVLVHADPDRNAVLDFIAPLNLTYRDNIKHLIDTEFSLWNRFQVIQQPTSLLIDANGEITSSQGAFSAEGLDVVAARLELRNDEHS